MPWKVSVTLTSGAVQEAFGDKTSMQRLHNRYGEAPLVREASLFNPLGKRVGHTINPEIKPNET